MVNKLIIKLNGREWIVDVNANNLNKFTDDCLVAFDDVLREVVSRSRMKIPYIETNEEQKVEIDNYIDSLKNE